MLMAVEQLRRLARRGFTCRTRPRRGSGTSGSATRSRFNNAGPWYTVIGPMVDRPGQFGHRAKPRAVRQRRRARDTSPLSYTTTAGGQRRPTYPGVPASGQRAWTTTVTAGSTRGGTASTTTITAANWLSTTISSGSRTRLWQGCAGDQRAPCSNAYVHDPAPAGSQINAREVSLPSDVVIDASSWGVTNEPLECPAEGPARVSSAAVQYVFRLHRHLGQPRWLRACRPRSTSTPSSVGLSAFYHFWLAERSDVYAPTFTTTTA